MIHAPRTPQDLIEECQGLVRSLALKIHRGLPAHVDLDDLIGYGQIGLAEAARDYDSTRGELFSTFAYYRIRGEIYDGLSRMSWVKRSQYQKLKYDQMSNDVLRLENENGAGTGEKKVEDEAGWLKNITAALAVVYLSTNRAGEDDDGHEGAVEDQRALTPMASAERRESFQRLNELIDELPDDGKALIRATYFDGLTLTEAGEKIGVSKAWASRLHAKTLQQLARSLRVAGLAD